MKTIAIGDIHGLSIWKDIINKENPDKVIFIGDYFDSFDISLLDQLNNFQEIIDYKLSTTKEVILLIGNHDFHYYPGIYDIQYTGYQTGGSFNITSLIDYNKNHLQIAYKLDNILFTHAGVSSRFMNDVFGENEWNVNNIDNDLNDLFKYKPLVYHFYGREPYGDDIEQTPIWIRPRSLMKSNKKTLRKQLIQVVGHTVVNQIDKKGKATGGKYYFIDCLPTSKEYLIINDGIISVGNLN